MQQKCILINIKNYVILSDISGASSPGFIVKDGQNVMVLYLVLFRNGYDGSVSDSLPSLI